MSLVRRLVLGLSLATAAACGGVHDTPGSSTPGGMTTEPIVPPPIGTPVTPPPGTPANPPPAGTPANPPPAGTPAMPPPAGTPTPAMPPPAGTPTTTVGVTIQGKFIQKDDVVVFLHIGHSNMAGRATGPAALRPLYYDVDPHLWVYKKGGVWLPAKEPTAGNASLGDAAGPGMAILHTALAASPNKVFVSIGHGQSGADGEAVCPSFRKGGLLYDVFMDRARELAGKVTFGGLYTMLGLTEHHLASAQQKMFADCMAGLAAEVRADLGDPNIPFMVGDYEAGATREDIAPSTPFAQGIIAQIKLIPGKTMRAGIIPTDGLPMQDNHHYDMTGHKLWAERAMKIMKDGGWAPWATN